MRISDWSADVCSSDLLAAESDNLRGLLHWLGSDVEAVPAQRLRRLVLKTGLEASADRLVLHNTDLRLDVSRLTGGAAIAHRARPGLRLAPNPPKDNPDPYPPEPGPAPDPEPRPEPPPPP